MKRGLVIVFSFLFLTIVAVIVVPSFIDWSIYKDQAARIVRENTGLNLDIKGRIGFSVVPAPSLHIEQVSLKVAQSVDTKEKHMLAAFERLEVNLDLMSLFKKQITVFLRKNMRTYYNNWILSFKQFS